MKQTRTKIKSWIPVYYAICGAIWILLSDHLLTAFVRDVPIYAFIGTIKGWIFIAVTATALYLIVLLDEKRNVRLELQYQDLFDASPDGIFVVSNFGQIFNANQEAVRQYGYSVPELVGKSLFDLMAKKDATAKHEFLAVLTGEKPCFLATNIAKSGELIEVEIRARFVELGGQDCVICTVRNITVQKSLEMERDQMLSRLEAANLNLKTAYEVTLEGWSRALDLRDKETEGHSLRVTELTVFLAHEMGVDQDALLHIRRGCLLHDIGKMGVPDNILLKPAALVEDEWAVMKRHPEFARDLIAPINYLRGAVDIPYCHHERWDGSGYPRGLKGVEIPLGARIFAVVDVWDALTSDRPYRKAWPNDEALAYLHKNSGVLFDPAAVDAFTQMMAE